LTIDKEKCITCDVCNKLCPKEAVKYDCDNILIEREKCVLCGLCVPFCPLGALNIFINNEEKIILNQTKGLPN